MLFTPPVGPLPKYVAQGVRFDGTNDNLVRGGGLTGAADSKMLTGSFWLLNGSDGGSHQIFAAATSLGGTTLETRLGINTSNAFSIIGSNAAESTILNVSSSDNVFQAADGWTHAVFSFDMSDTGKRHIYVDDASDLTVTTYTDEALDFTMPDWLVGRNAAGRANFSLADFLLWPGTYLDLSVAANRRLFISAAGKPVNPSAAIATLGTPLVRLSGPTADWHTNKGSGGGFTEVGAIADAASSPSD